MLLSKIEDLNGHRVIMTGSFGLACAFLQAGQRRVRRYLCVGFAVVMDLGLCPGSTVR
jgi:hypothetical protein